MKLIQVVPDVPAFGDLHGAICIDSYRLDGDGAVRPQTGWLQIFRPGAVFDADGTLVDTFTAELFLEVAATFDALSHDPARRPKLDWNHGSVDPIMSVFPAAGQTYGELVDVHVDAGGLWGRFTLTRAGIELIQRQEGDLFLSPTLTNEPIHHPSTGEVIGRGLFAVALTPSPRQDQLQAVRLSMPDLDVVFVDYHMPAARRGGHRMPATEGAAAAATMEHDELVAALEAAQAKIAELEAKLAALAEEDKEGAADQELAALEASVAELRAEAKAARLESYQAKRDAQIETLVSTGRITPAERADAVSAYDAFHLDGSSYNAFERHFASRKPSSAWPTGAVGRAVTPPGEPTDESVRVACRQAARENGTTFWDEHKSWRAANPETAVRLYGREH